LNSYSHKESRQFYNKVLLSSLQDERYKITWVSSGYNPSIMAASPKYRVDINQKVDVVDSPELSVVYCDVTEQNRVAMSCHRYNVTSHHYDGSRRCCYSGVNTRRRTRRMLTMIYMKRIQNMSFFLLKVNNPSVHHPVWPVGCEPPNLHLVL
jgi:hypothetical protein